MGNLSPTADRFIQETFHKAHSFETLLHSIKARTPQVGTKSLLNIAVAISRNIRVSLEMELEANPHLSSDQVLDMCARRQQLIDSLHKRVFDVIQPAEYSLYPIGVIAATEDLVSDIVPTPALILNPYSGSTYEILAYHRLFNGYRDTLSPYVKDISEEEEKLPEWAIILSYPAVQSTNILLHTIMMGHEVIHLKDHVDKISSGLIATRQVRITKTAVRREAARLGEEPQRLFEETEPVLRQWLAELVADLVAVRVYGPAYLFSFARLSLALQVMDHYSDSHPSSRMRLGLMLGELRSLGYFQEYIETRMIREELHHWLTFAASPVPQPERSHYVAFESIMRAKTHLTRRVRTATQGIEFNVNQFIAQVPPLLEYLQHGIPPSETLDIVSRRSDPASIPSILNAGTLYYLQGMSQLKDMLATHEEKPAIAAMTKLSGLLARGIEASYAFKEWRDGETIAQS